MKKIKRLLSLTLAMIMLLTSVCVSFFAYAVEDFSKDYDLQVYYYNDSKEFVEVTEQLSVMEQEDIQLYACLVYKDGTVWDITTSGMPADLEGYTLEWHSDARYLAFSEENDGKIHGYDATKGEAIRNWLDNEVATIPVVGGLLKSAILAMIDNDKIDIDDLDTEDVTKILDNALKTINVDEEQRAKLTNSLAEYLNKFDVGISAILRDADGKEVARDTVRVLVLKSDKLLSDVIPNAAFIKNYDDIPTTVAVGYEMDLEGIITPVRTHYTTVWTVTGMLGVLGSDLAEVDENGHFKAIGEGTVQIKVSPDIDGVTRKIKDALEKVSAVGEMVDSETMAKAILLILGIKSDSDNYTTLVNIVKRIVDSGVIGSDGSTVFDDGLIKQLTNFILYVIYQDAITIKIVNPKELPVVSFDIEGNEKVEEGKTTTLSITNIHPKGAVAHDYEAYVENEEYAVKVDDLTFMGIDGSKTNLNYITSNNTDVVVTMDGVTKSFKLKVYGNGNRQTVYIKINCDDYLEIGKPANVDAVAYPKRITPSLSYGWEYEDGSVVYATENQPAMTEDGLASVTADGIMSATGCTVNNVVVKDVNGATQKKQIMSGIQTTGVEFSKKHFWTKCKSGIISTGIRGAVCEISADILPSNASFNELTFTCADTESVILSPTPLTSAQFATAALTEERRLAHSTATVTCDENGHATVYAYAVGNTACYSDISVTSRTGGHSDSSTVAYSNMSVTGIDITSDKDDDKEIHIDDSYYLIEAHDSIDFDAKVNFDQAGSWKHQGFEDVEWSVSDDKIGTIAQNGIFTGKDVGIVTVKVVSVYEEKEKTVTVKVLPDYKAIKEAMANCDYENLNPYDWSDESWARFDEFYQTAVQKLKEHSFTSQNEVDVLTDNIIKSFNGLVRYLPITGLELSCDNDEDGNGFATISVGALQNYTSFTSQIVATVYPEEAQDYKLTFTSSNPDLLQVDETGLCVPVTNKNAPWAKITVSVTDPKNGTTFTKEMYVAFAKYQVAKVSTDPSYIQFVGENAQSQHINSSYSTSSLLTSASIKEGFFVSSDESVATVNENGDVTPVSAGQCKIIFYSVDGGYTANTNIEVFADKTALESAINKASLLNEDDYTIDSFAPIPELLQGAKNVFAQAYAKQSVVDEATKSLVEAMDALVISNDVRVSVVSDGNGDAFLNEIKNGSIRIERGNEISLNAIENDGYEFVSWTDEANREVSRNKSVIVTVDGAHTYKANFKMINYVDNVILTVENTETNYYTKAVTATLLTNYTKQSVNVDVNVYPQNADSYSVSYALGVSKNMTLDGTTLRPTENNVAYAQVIVTVKDNKSGEIYIDDAYVAFTKNKMASVSSSPSSMNFEAVNSPSQKITHSFTLSNRESAATYGSGIKEGYYVSSNENVAKVDNDGNVTPVSAGSCTVSFISYDGGHRAETAVTVDNCIIFTGKIVVQQGPKEDFGAIPVSDATVNINGSEAVTNSNGQFTLLVRKTDFPLNGSVVSDHCITREFTIYASNAYYFVIPVVAVDYVNDGVINAKDYAFMIRNGASQDMIDIYKKFINYGKFSTDNALFEITE